MATATTKAKCSVCKKETSTFNCDGCSQKFCWNDLNKHRQLLNGQLDEIESEHNQFRQKLLDQKQDPNSHPSIEEIDQWEEESIQLIKQRANKCREKLINYLNRLGNKLETQLNELAKQIKNVRDENEFNEIDINHLKEKLQHLEQELNRPPNTAIRQESTSFIKNLTLITETKMKQNGITSIGEYGKGNQLNQLCQPRSVFIEDNQTFYIADCDNHRIVEWKTKGKTGRIVAGQNGRGYNSNQLYNPIDVIVDKETNSLIISDYGNRRVMRWSLANNTTGGEIIISDVDCWGIAMDKDGSLYVVDFKKNEVRRWKRGDTNGTIVAGGNGEGGKFNQLNVPNHIFVDDDYSLYISDRNNHRVMKWMKDAKEGIIVAGGNGKGNNLKQLSQPQGVIVDKVGQIYVADWDNHRVMRWREDEKEGSIVIGGNGQGAASNQFDNPQGLSFDRQGNIYVVDCNNHRIQKFEIDFD